MEQTEVKIFSGRNIYRGINKTMTEEKIIFYNYTKEQKKRQDAEYKKMLLELNIEVIE